MDQKTTPDIQDGTPPVGFPFPPEAFCRHCQVRIVGSGVAPCRSRPGEAPCEPAPCEAAEALAVAPAFPPLPVGLVWSVTAVHVGVQVRADGVKLTVTIGWELFDQEYVAIAVETADGASDDAILAEHAHELLGRFKTEPDAKAAGESFAAKWREGADAAACECGPIEAEPAGGE